MDRWPSINKFLDNTQSVPSLIDKWTNVNGGWNYMLSMLGTVLEDGLPWSLSWNSNIMLEFFWSVQSWVENPFLLWKIVVICSNQILSEVESLNFFRGELSGEDIKVFTWLSNLYTRESMLAKNKLLFICNSLA